MNRYYFTQGQEYIAVEYASSNRSTCRSCKQKIEKQELRMGLCVDEDHFNGKYWYHLECFSLKPRHKQIDPENIQDKIWGTGQISREDYHQVAKRIKEEIQRMNRGGKKVKAILKKQVSAISQDNQKKQEDEENRQDQAKKIKMPKRGKNGKFLKSKSKSVPKRKSQKQAKVSESQSSDQPIDDNSSDEDYGKRKKRKPANKKVKKQATKKKAVKPKNGYNQAEKKQFKQLCDQYSNFSMDKLKEQLALNHQSKTGIKKQLVQKCADGKLKGQIPMCSSCGGGKLRFDRITGVYTCPGYMQDTDFIRCGKKFEYNQVQRSKWITS